MIFGDDALTLRGDVQYTFWDARTGGDQILTITHVVSGVPSNGLVRTRANGSLPLLNETTGTYLEMWADAGDGMARRKIYTDPSQANISYGSSGAVFVSGRWYPTATSTSTALLIIQNTVYAGPMPVLTARAFNAVGVNTTVAGTGGTVRFGIYADNGAGYPGALVVDFGTTSAVVTGALSLAVTQTLPQGLYWLVVVGQGGTVQPTVTTINPVGGGAIVPILGSANPGVTGGNTGYSTAGQSGALPATFPAGGSILGANASPLVQLKAV